MTAVPYTIVVCNHTRELSGEPSCGGSGGEALAAAIEAEIGRRGADVTLRRIACLGHCENGPALRLAPGGRFFHRVEEGDIAEIVDRAMEGPKSLLDD